ncbi:MAG TPA: hypothetical protein VEY50_03445 [Lysobacter sp.]|nr:hypothetical protein [Lysobacter sp.]
MTTKAAMRFPKSTGSKGADDSKKLTSERIAEHLAAFQAAGGQVEVLGVTRVLKRLDLPQPPEEPAKRPRK